MIYFRGTKDIHLDHTVVALGKFAIFDLYERRAPQNRRRDGD